jgi:hypothetical protein
VSLWNYSQALEGAQHMTEQPSESEHTNPQGSGTSRPKRVTRGVTTRTLASPATEVLNEEPVRVKGSITVSF